MKFPLSLTALFIGVFTLQSQAQFEVGATLSPSFSNIQNSPSSSISLDNLFSVNGGLNIRFTEGNFMFTTGIEHLTQGISNDMILRDDNGTITGSTKYYYRARTVAVPIQFDYFMRISDELSIISGVGVQVGYLYSERASSDAFPSYDPETFDDLYFAYKIGAGVIYHLNNEMSIQARPYYSRQITEDHDFGNTSLYSLGVDFGFYFRLH